ncbi:MAG TPA: bifunctional riboflavin kinase/FAD synthetase [Ktedonobacteraceae bacterium]
MEYTTNTPEHAPVAITIGNFDGLHRGHQHLLHELRKMAQALDCIPVFITFLPHTLIVVRPPTISINEVRCLTTLEEKLELVKQYGEIDHYIIIHFTHEVAAMSAEEFLQTLREHFTVKGMVVGENFSLGHNRRGNIEFLTTYGQKHHIHVQTVPLQEADTERISSTRIRHLVQDGNIQEAHQLLGHPVIFSGIVQHGDGRGHLIGFPTANLRPDEHRLLPADGVYAACVHVPDGPESDSNQASTVYYGVVNIGIRPTFNKQERLVEAHLLDTTIDLYGKLITVEFITRLRGEQRFSGIDALKAQIQYDAQQARQILTRS